MQNLNNKFPIVNSDGTPTDYFIRLFQTRGSAQESTDADVATLADSVSHKVNETRSIVSGAGLTGGGDLTADRTLAVGAGTGITVNADDVAVDITAEAERIRDVIGAALVAGSNVTITVNDPADTITIASTGGGGGTTSSPLDPASYAISNSNGASNNYCRVYLKAGTVVTGVEGYPNAAGTLNFGSALYGPIGSASQIVTGTALLASSAIASKTVTAGSTNRLPFTSPFTITTDGYYYICYYQGSALAHLTNATYFEYFNGSTISSFPSTGQSSGGSANRMTGNWY